MIATLMKLQKLIPWMKEPQLYGNRIIYHFG